MSQISADFLKKYEALLTKDPDSQAFAPLAEAYLKMNQPDRAQALATHGVKKHPQFAGGRLVLGQVFLQSNKLPEAIEQFEAAVQLSPENIRAHTRLGHALLQNHQGRAALGAFKMVLLLNPRDKEAAKIVAKLESLSATDYEEDLFKLEPLSVAKIAPETENTEEPEANSTQREFKRKLSLIDAFLARSDFSQAEKLLADLKLRFKTHKAIEKREKMLARYQDSLVVEQAEPIKPRPRETMIREQKIRTLEKLLQKVELWQKQGASQEVY